MNRTYGTVEITTRTMKQLKWLTKALPVRTAANYRGIALTPTALVAANGFCANTLHWSNIDLPEELCYNGQVRFLDPLAYTRLSKEKYLLTYALANGANGFPNQDWYKVLPYPEHEVAQIALDPRLLHAILDTIDVNDPYPTEHHAVTLRIFQPPADLANRKDDPRVPVIVVDGLKGLARAIVMPVHMPQAAPYNYAGYVPPREEPASA